MGYLVEACPSAKDVFPQRVEKTQNTSLHRRSRNLPGSEIFCLWVSYQSECRVPDHVFCQNDRSGVSDLAHGENAESYLTKANHTAKIAKHLGRVTDRPEISKQSLYYIFTEEYDRTIYLLHNGRNIIKELGRGFHAR